MKDDAPPISGLLEGKYQLVQMIGRGGMGSVWEAKHATLGTRFAIKFIEAEYSDSVEARSRFDKEARAAATIQSKHAIQIYDHGVTKDGKPYIVMELLVGDPLDKLLEKAGGSLDLSFTANIIAQVSRGLQRAHERGIVHRDLKPENIFWVRTEEEEIAKVLDFGIAKMNGIGGAPTGVTSSTKTGAVLGTPFYMSPEQARGLRNVDHRTDVWSLGVIAFKCVTGKLPFDGESVGDLLVKICTGSVPMPSSVRPGLPASFDQWFMRSLEREPERRFQSVSEQADALMVAAGLTPGRGPMSNMNAPYMATAAAVSGGAYLQTPPPGPMYGSSPGSGTPQPQQQAQQVPPAGAMTAAPFTSSQSVPGVPSGGMGKIVAIAGICVFLGAALTGGYFWKKGHEAKITNGLVVAPPPPVSVAAGAGDKPPPPADPPPAETTTPLPSTPKQGSGTAPAGLPGKVPTKVPPATTKPVASEKPVVVVTPPASHDPPAKKPPATKLPSDPGY